MNERIKELARTAGIKLFDDGSVLFKNGEVSKTGSYIEKLAELIVRDCLNVAKLAHSEGNEDIYSYDDALDHVEYNLKQYFGVK